MHISIHLLVRSFAEIHEAHLHMLLRRASENAPDPESVTPIVRSLRSQALACAALEWPEPTDAWQISTFCNLCHQVTRIQSRSAFDKVMQMRCEICRLGLCRTSRLTGTARHGPCHCVSGPGKAQRCKKRHSNDLTMSLVLEPRLVRPSSYVPPMYNKEAVVLCNILKSKTLHV